MMDGQLSGAINEENKSQICVTMTSKPSGERKDDHKQITAEEGEFEKVSDQLQSSLDELRQFREELVDIERTVVENQAKFSKEISTFRNVLQSNDNKKEKSNENVTFQSKNQTVLVQYDKQQSTSASQKETGRETSDNVVESDWPCKTDETSNYTISNDVKPKSKVASKEETIQSIPFTSSHQKIKNASSPASGSTERKGREPSQDGSPKSKFAHQKETSAGKSSKAGEIRDRTRVKRANSIAELHLSSVKITEWKSANKKPNDAATMEKVKQICGSLDGDDIYHYENIDDFDDTNKHLNPIATKNKLKVINCKFASNQDGVCSPTNFCNSIGKRGKSFDQRRYILGEIARGKTLVSCWNKGCSNVYDPWDVARFLGTKDGYHWYETVAVDPLKSKHTDNGMKQNSIVKKVSVSDTTKEETPVDTAKEETPDKQLKKKWWRKKNKVAKQKDDSSGRSETHPKKEIKPFVIDALVGAESKSVHKYECDTCLGGFDDDLQKGYISCGHYNCKSCLKIYFSNQIINMITDIECPRPDCKEEFDCRFIIRLLSQEHRMAYVRLCRIRRELEYAHLSKDIQLKPVCQQGPGCTDNKCVCKQPSKPESWVEKSKRFGYCPKCETIIEKRNDGSCNIVCCMVCRTEFCWVCKKICGEKIHLFECPLWGNKKFSKRRVILNYISFGATVAIGGPLVLGITLGR